MSTRLIVIAEYAICMHNFSGSGVMLVTNPYICEVIAMLNSSCVSWCFLHKAQFLYKKIRRKER